MSKLFKHPFFWLQICVVSILLLFFGKYILHPNAYIFNVFGDGIKNYFTPQWFVKYNSGTHFNGMNYPFGEHVLYTDNQPMLSWLLNLIDNNFISISNYTVGIINSLMFISFWLCAIFLYKILVHYQIPAWYAAFAALCITCLSPQFERITVHYALSYSLYIPLLWWLHILATKNNYRLIFVALIILSVTFFGFIHLYYLLIGLLFIFTYFLVAIFRKQSTRKEILSLACILVIPLIIIFTFIHFTDGIDDRPSAPYGFFTYKATLQSILLPCCNDLTTYIYENNFLRPANYEGYAYLGFAGVFVFVITVFQYIINSIRSRIFLPAITITPNNLSGYVIAAIIVLLFSMSLPFSLGLESLLDVLPIINQFRSPGRFVWIFYFVFLVYTTYYGYNMFEKYYRQKKWVTILLASIFLLITINESKNTLQRKKESIEVTKAENPFLEKNIFWSSFLTMNGYTPEDFQAVLFVPFFLQGSEKLYIDRTDYGAGSAMEIAYQNGLPLINGMLSRTSISQSLQLAQVVGHPSIEKTVIEKFNTKDILLVTNDKNLIEGEKYLISKSKFIGQQAHIKYYVLPVSAFTNTQESIKQYFSGARDTFYFSATEKYYAEKPIGLFYKNDFDEMQSPEPFTGPGSLYAEKGKIFITDIPINITDTIWIEVSFWAKTYDETTAYPHINVYFLDARDSIIKMQSPNPKFSSDIIHDWVRASDNYDVPPHCKKLRLETSNHEKINFDCLLVRHTAYAVFYNLDEQGGFWFNNYPIGK